MQTNTFVRAPKSKENPFAQINRALLQNRELSYEARGLLAYLLSHSNDWKINIKDLKQQCSSDRVYRIINELIEKGYVKRKRIVNEKGKFIGIRYWTYEEPTFDEDDSPLRENPDMEIAQKENNEILLYRDNNEIEKENKRFTDKSVNGNAQAPLPDATLFPLAANPVVSITNENPDTPRIENQMTTGEVTVTEVIQSQNGKMPKAYQELYMRYAGIENYGYGGKEAKLFYGAGITTSQLDDMERMNVVIASISNMDLNINHNRKSIWRYTKDMYRAGYSVSDVERFYAWWLSNDWNRQNNQHPTPKKISENIQKSKEAMPSSEPFATSESIYGSYAPVNLNELE